MAGIAEGSRIGRTTTAGAAVLGLLVLGTSGAARPASAQASGDSGWVEVSSPPFVVISDAGEEKARAVAQDFQRARALAEAVWPVLPVLPVRPGIDDALGASSGRWSLDHDQPLVIFAVRNGRGLRALIPQFWERRQPRPVAVFWRGPHKHHIALRLDVSDQVRFRRVAHEYTHLLRSVNLPVAPGWLDEGLSEFVEAAYPEKIEQDNPMLEIGRPVSRHLRALGRMLPLEELLSTPANTSDRDSGRDPRVFYAEAWALVHYLTLGGGRSGGPGALAEYVRLWKKGTGSIAAATEAFGALSDLEAALADYIKARQFRVLRVNAPDVFRQASVPVTVRGLSPAEALAERGNFIAYGERPASARPLLQRALELDPRQALALESLGYIDFLQNRPRDAVGWFDRAAATGKASYLTYFYRALLAESSGTEMNDDLVARVEADLILSIDLNDGFAPAHARLASLYMERQSAGLAASHFSRAVELEPENLDYWIGLGQALVQAGRLVEAKAAGKQALALATTPEARDLVASLLPGLDLE